MQSPRHCADQTPKPQEIPVRFLFRNKRPRWDWCCLSAHRPHSSEQHLAHNRPFSLSAGVRRRGVNMVWVLCAAHLAQNKRIRELHPDTQSASPRRARRGPQVRALCRGFFAAAPVASRADNRHCAASSGHVTVRFVRPCRGAVLSAGIEARDSVGARVLRREIPWEAPGDIRAARLCSVTTCEPSEPRTPRRNH